MSSSANSSSSSSSSSPTTTTSTTTTSGPPTTTPPPPPSSTTSPPPSSSSTPPTTPPPPPPSSSASSSSAGSQSSTSSASSSTFSPPTSSAPLQNSTSSDIPTSTIVATTLITTDAQGQPITTVQTTRAAASATPAASRGSSHTGAIVGGAVGGVAGLAILGLLVWYCFRRQRRKDDFDGNFDPDRVGHGQPGQLDLTAGEVEPYTYPHEGGDMREGAEHPYGGAVAAGGMHGGPHEYQNVAPDGSDYTTDTRTSPSYLSPAAAGAGALSTSSSGFSPPRSAKEREAFARYHNGGPGSSTVASGSTGLQVANHHEGDQDRATSPVVVHQDGGRVRVPPGEEDEAREIPPTYDSIPADGIRR